MDLYDRLVYALNQEGFPLVGVVDLDSAIPYLKIYSSRYEKWLAKGFAAEMNYLYRSQEKKADPRKMFSEAKSVLCVAYPYSAKPAGGSSFLDGPRYARYLRGKDYHLEISESLDRAMNYVREH